MGGGGQSYDYRPEIRQGLAQANLPKSPLAQTYSNAFQGAVPDLFGQLSNMQFLGNSMIGRNQAPTQSYQYSPYGNQTNVFGGQWGGGGYNGSYGGYGGQSQPFNYNTLQSQQYNLQNNPPPSQFLPIPKPAGVAVDYNSLSPAERMMYTGVGQLAPGESWNPMQQQALDQGIPFSQLMAQSNPSIGNYYSQLGLSPSDPRVWADAPTLLSMGIDPNTWQPINPTNYQPTQGFDPQQLFDPNYNPNYGNQSLQQYNLNLPKYTGGGQGAYAPFGTQGNGLNIDPTMLANPALGQLNLQGMDPLSVSRLQQGIGNPGLNQSMMSIPGLANALQQIIGTGAGQNVPQQVQAMMLSGGGAQGLNLGDINPRDSEFYQAVQQALGNKQTKDVADLRSMFGAAGNTSRGTPAQYAEASLRAQQAPEIASALGNVRQQEAANLLQAAGIGNAALLQNQSLMNQLGLSNQAAGLQAGMANQGAGLQYGQNMTNYLGQLGNVFGTSGNLGLGYNQLGSQNYFNQQGLQSQNALGMLGAQNQYLGNYNQAINQANQGNIGLSQFNAGQVNTNNLGLAGMNQQAYTDQLNRYVQGLMALYSGGLGLAGAGIPGGSANINLSNPQSQQGFNLGGFLQGIGNLFQGIGAIK